MGKIHWALVWVERGRVTLYNPAEKSLPDMPPDPYHGKRDAYVGVQVAGLYLFIFWQRLQKDQSAGATSDYLVGDAGNLL
ncbi:hypothetical protein HKBW3S43_00290 [Candidatus Hakubella thermalkaliphila]|uniref:Uncharacterized protein n=1 Tax=Candidatus Hakubella thermalkaliphila TaxID=2754717 RepID=A0A6V8PQH1_9ACTN|nr:hypothetical protein HKBW3S33_01520 [Candidatus Hakubella thermalkaliphila]GFP34497.1 hypothetical protein HKBW3S43_00290 [Candidatus Hakubella thermalkaliphila]